MSRKCIVKSKNELLWYQKRFGTDHAVGLQLGVTRQAVHQLRNKFGIMRSLKKSDRNAKIKVDHWNGMDADKLVKKYKLSLTQIYRIIK